jgi:trk system potassium uptake protein TrkA
MHVIVVGCGRVGVEVARQLVVDGHDVVVIDKRSDTFRRLGEDFPGRTMVGIGFDRDTLTDAGISGRQRGHGGHERRQLATSSSPAWHARRSVSSVSSPASTTPQRALVYQRLGIATVAPALWTTERVLRRLVPNALPSSGSDPSAKVSLVERRVSPWAGSAVLSSRERRRAAGRRCQPPRFGACCRRRRSWCRKATC